MRDYRKHYSRFLSAHPNVQHFACHSHHYWPDVTRDAQIQYWDDACRLVDAKWDYFFSEIAPRTQNHLAQLLSVRRPEQIVFAANTHELLARLLSCLDPQRKIRVLTTDGEFYTFERQISRLAENSSQFEVHRIPCEPYATLDERMLAAIQSGPWDFFFFSHVFFKSGIVSPLHSWSNASAQHGIMTVVDGYHGFMAIPTDLSSWRAYRNHFYLAGSYKYAQGGEGACFLVVPENSAARPQNTGWFACFDQLENYANEVQYSDSGLRFAGSTMDFSAVYRLLAVLDLFAEEGISVEDIHGHICGQQQLFLEALDAWKHPDLHRGSLVLPASDSHGHFFSFNVGSLQKMGQLRKELGARNILTDGRGSYLRFGFGLYHHGSYRL